MKRFAMILGLLSMVTLFGCATKTGSGTLLGAGAGAALGAGIGAIAGGGKGAAIGAAAGAMAGGITGAGIGKYMDRQEEELRKKNLDATIERQGDQLVVRFKSGILYGVGKADLMPTSQKQLADFAKVLTDYPQTNVVIEGHTDNTGAIAYNQDLSEKRAVSVGEFLSFQGVDNQRMQIFGYGKERPIADNTTEVGRQQNRRVEIRIMPISGANAESEKSAK